nr:FKBP-type peptidyl-prolyl cis-trans isomerase [Leucobacter exalbidus]
MTGCSAAGAPTKDAAGVECLASGSASSSLKVSGDIGADAKLTSKAPVTAKKLERSVITEGDGKVAKEGQSVTVSMAMFNGKTGASIQQQPASAVPLVKDTLNDWAYEGLRCALPGETVGIVAPYNDFFGSEMEPEATGLEGFTKKDSIVIVMQVEEINDAAAAEEPVAPTNEPGTLEPDELLKKAEGTAKDAPEGFPTVKLAKDGAPTITMPKGDAPKKLEVATIIEGDGETVEPGDRVYVNYRGVIWRTGEEFDSSWSRGEAANFTTTGVIGGFQQALEGQKVGSQIISVVPAEDGGYGADGLTQMGHEPDDVMVFVLDILGTVHADAK